MPKSYAVIGGGIVGLAVAHQLTERFPGAEVTVIEKESRVGQHQSGHNSGVLHAGLYYKPGSLKARLAVNGIRRMIAFCRQHAIAHEVCGKLVTATAPEELPRLQELLTRGTANGLSGLRWLEGGALREIEPHVAGIAAVHVPEEGIVDYPAVCDAMARVIGERGGRVLTGAPARAIRPAWIIEAGAHEVRAEFLFNCAGLHSDRVLALAGERRTARIVPFRGEYFKLAPAAQHLVRHLIYPVPDPKFPFLGVHFTRLIHGGVECGPNAVLALSREGYRWSSIHPGEFFDAITFPGLWRFLRKYPGMSLYEIRRSLDRNEFCRSLQRLIPEVRREHLAPGGSGVRAQAMAPDGTLLQDFDFVRRANALHLINAPSPGATASLAIADYLIDETHSLQS